MAAFYNGFSATPGDAMSVPTGDAARAGNLAWTVTGGQPTGQWPTGLHSGAGTSSKLGMNSRHPFKTDWQDRQRELVKGR